MVRIRLRRVGAKKQAHYRVVVADQRSPRDGRHIETIGFYNPRTEPETVKIKEDRALFWLSQGAQPSDVVQRMLEKQGTLARFVRIKAGESLEALVAEYETGAAGEESVEPAEAEVVEPAEAEVVEPAEAEVVEPAEAEVVEPAEAEVVEPVASAETEETEEEVTEVEPEEAEGEDEPEAPADED